VGIVFLLLASSYVPISINSEAIFIMSHHSMNVTIFRIYVLVATQLSPHLSEEVSEHLPG
jgi:hypothetical protein